MKRVETLEPLRGLAALAVAWFHFTNGGPLLPEGSILRMSGQYGWAGVEVFFVISGFIIPYSMSRNRYRLPQDIFRFLAKRIVRLDPPYLLAIALTVGLWYASTLAPGFRGNQPDISAGQLAAHLGYLNAVIGYPWLNPVFWTLAIEFQFYIFVAVIYPALDHRRPVIRFATLAVMAGLPFVVTAEAYLFRYLGLFALGGAAYHLWQRQLGRLGFVGVVAAIAVGIGYSLGPVICVAGVGTALVIGLVNKLPRWQPFCWLGSISYSLYLIHVPIGGRIVNLGSRFANSPATHAAVLAAAVVISLLVAYIFYRLVEKPTWEWSGRIRYGPNR